VTTANETVRLVPSHNCHQGFLTTCPCIKKECACEKNVMAPTNSDVDKYMRLAYVYAKDNMVKLDVFVSVRQMLAKG